ncbi:Not1 N-terminal domain, CCR4-Not complex component-domain-containing protein [Rhodofomes roseus]|uniref:General negative regulator of transcription subunit n=1 Tax=Rhodofomes roseus TaxID=34475 RepID=A0ABQ8KWL5_9APHY|nr:Not1 N-terminal domain, CCR4-Not complex component-domain-containing protein [Rhodofomes roseus]KAH9843689.1 Not1 N-terminal domain, CCR4-Not complex component-domain-containing protein [Rhodofomes roseus]
MAARKLQTEIDRTLKKVAEGVELFESIYDKMQASTNQTQKEKLETDLKTQIKKLQRLRDQIKTWVASNDIKDKTALLDNRRLIETQMEKFKACEKEMKTKAFSKEGLTQHAKLDPKAQEKLEVTQWVNNQVEELQLQLEQAEAEIETLQGGGKKKNKAGGAAAERLETLEQLNERRKWHISRLEIILRLLDNGTLPTEKVLGLKEDVQYFVESNMDENFDEDEGIYDELNLDEEEEKFGLANDDDSDESEAASDDLPPRTPSKKHDEESVASSNKRDGSPVLKKATVTLQLRTKPPNANFAAQPMASILKVGLPPPLRPAPLPVRYAAAAAAAVAPSTPQSAVQPPSTPSATIASSSNQPAAPTAPSIASTTAASSLTPDQVSAVTSSPSLTHLSVTSPMLSSAASVSAQHADGYTDSPALSEAVPSSIGGPAATSSPQRIQRKASTSSPTAVQALASVVSCCLQSPTEAPPQSLANGPPQLAPGAIPSAGYSPMPQQAQAYPSSSAPAANAQSSSSSPLPPTQLPQYPPGVKASGAGPALDLEHSVPPGVIPQQNLGVQRPGSTVPTQMPQQAPPARPSAFPGSLSDLVVSFENVKQKAPHRMSNLDQVHKLLQGSYSSMPQPQDTEKPKYYVPRNPIQTPAYYPQTPNPILNTAGIFSQLDVETLFYVFYYLPGTYQQYLAAKELKRQSWRFHVKYLTWFQRHSEPQAITEEYEQGVYVYFDWEGSWCQRKKSDFRFEYRYLSED